MIRLSETQLCTHMLVYFRIRVFGVTGQILNDRVYVWAIADCVARFCCILDVALRGVFPIGLIAGRDSEAHGHGKRSRLQLFFQLAGIENSVNSVANVLDANFWLLIVPSLLVYSAVSKIVLYGTHVVSKSVL